jgi:hypothetical protein
VGIRLRQRSTCGCAKGQLGEVVYSFLFMSPLSMAEVLRETGAVKVLANVLFGYIAR